MQCSRAKNILGLLQVFAVARAKASGLQLVSTHGRLMHRRIELDAHGVVDALSDSQFVTRIANWSKDTLELPEKMVEAQSFPLYTVKKVVLDESVSAVQLYKNQKSVNEETIRHFDVVREDATKQVSRWTEQV